MARTRPLPATINAARRAGTMTLPVGLLGANAPVFSDVTTSLLPETLTCAAPATWHERARFRQPLFTATLAETGAFRRPRGGLPRQRQQRAIRPGRSPCAAVKNRPAKPPAQTTPPSSQSPKLRPSNTMPRSSPGTPGNAITSAERDGHSNGNASRARVKFSRSSKKPRP